MLDKVARDGLVLLGCGKMGSALLQGWLSQGVPPASVWVIEPYPSDWLKAQGVNLNAGLPAAPAVVLIAVKPQMMGAALPQLQALAGGATLFLSIAAGTKIAAFEETFGGAAHIVRSMPNTPAAVARGITAMIGNANATPDDLDLAEALLSAVGQVVRLSSEDQIDAVTALSGGGPAYVFHLIEAMAAAGVAAGLPEEMSMQLARATVIGSGELARQSPESAAQMRINVTSPGGTTAEALKVLMDEGAGFPALLAKAVKAAADRGRELGK